MNRLRPIIILALCAALLPVDIANAAPAFETREFAVGGSPTLQLRNFVGDVRIRTGASDRIRLIIASSDDRIQVLTEQRIYFINVSVDYGELELSEENPVDFEIEIPPQCRVLVNNTMGSVSVSGVTGKIGLTTVGADISLVDSSGDIALRSVGGDISIRDIYDAELKAESISGLIDFQAETISGSAFSFENISGNINLTHGRDASYMMSASSTTGFIENRLQGITFLEDLVPSTPDGEVDFSNRFYGIDRRPFASGVRTLGGYNGEFTSTKIEAKTISGNISFGLAE